jgi:hypothetical protein
MLICTSWSKVCQYHNRQYRSVVKRGSDQRGQVPLLNLYSYNGSGFNLLSRLTQTRQLDKEIIESSPYSVPGILGPLS